MVTEAMFLSLLGVQVPVSVAPLLEDVGEVVRCFVTVLGEYPEYEVVNPFGLINVNLHFTNRAARHAAGFMEHELGMGGHEAQAGVPTGKEDCTGTERLAGDNGGDRDTGVLDDRDHVDQAVDAPAVTVDHDWNYGLFEFVGLAEIVGKLLTTFLREFLDPDNDGIIEVGGLGDPHTGVDVDGFEHRLLFNLLH